MNLEELKDLKKGSIITVHPDNIAGVSTSCWYSIINILTENGPMRYQVIDHMGLRFKIEPNDIERIIMLDPLNHRSNVIKTIPTDIPNSISTYPLHERLDESILNGVEFSLEQLQKVYSYEDLRIHLLKSLIALTNAEEIINAITDTDKTKQNNDVSTKKFYSNEKYKVNNIDKENKMQLESMINSATITSSSNLSIGKNANPYLFSIPIGNI